MESAAPCVTVSLVLRRQIVARGFVPMAFAATVPAVVPAKRAPPKLGDRAMTGAAGLSRRGSILTTTATFKEEARVRSQVHATDTGLVRTMWARSVDLPLTV